MKKKYGLEAIIGKKSRIRYPSHLSNQKIHTIYIILPANDAISEPPLNTSITLRKGDPLEFCDQFNEETYDYEEGFPLNTIIFITGGEQSFEVKAPTLTSLAGIIFDLEEIPETFIRSSRRDLFLAALNFSLIQLNPKEDFFISEVINILPSIYGSIFSFNKRYSYSRRAKQLTHKPLVKRYLVNTNLRSNRRAKTPLRLKLFFKKFFPYADELVLPLLVEQFHYSLNIYKSWEDSSYWALRSSYLLSYLMEYIQLAASLQILEENVENSYTQSNNKLPLFMDMITSSFLPNTIKDIDVPSKILSDFFLSEEIFAAEFPDIYYDIEDDIY